MPLHVSSTSAHHQEAQVESSQPLHGTATYRCDDTRDCIVQFRPPDDEHLCSKHVEAWNKLIIKFSASRWLILRHIEKHGQQNIKIYPSWVGYIKLYRSHWPRSLRRRSAAARLLRLWVRIPPETWKFVFCECCVLLGRGLCYGPITCTEEFLPSERH